MNVWLVLRKPHLSAVWFSQLFSSVGDQLFVVAFTWIAFEMAGSSAALLLSFGSVAGLVFALAGGVFADRFDRRRTLVVTDLLRAAVVVVLPVLILTDGLHVWHLAAGIVVMGALGTLFDPAMQASLPQLCQGDVRTLHSMNVLLDSTRRLARIAGPGLTGALLLIVPLAHFFTLDALTFVLSAGVLFLVRGSISGGKGRGAVTPRGALLSDLQTAFRLLRRQVLLFWALISLGLVNFAWSMAYQVGLPLLTKQVLHEDVNAFGIMSAAYGIGSMVSLLLMGAVRNPRDFRWMFWGQVILGIGFLMLGFSTHVAFAVIAIVIASIGSPMGDIMLLTSIQTRFPQDHIGKIYSLRMVIGGIGLAMGALAAAPLYEVFTVSTVMCGAALMIIFIGVVGLVRFRKTA